MAQTKPTQRRKHIKKEQLPHYASCKEFSPGKAANALGVRRHSRLMLGLTYLKNVCFVRDHVGEQPRNC